MKSHKIIASHTEISQRINHLAEQICDDFSDASPLFVSLLRGAAPFSSMLMFAIAKQRPDFHPEIDYMMISTYGSERTAGQPEIITGLAPTTKVAGRQVVVLDDVLDKGITADFVTRHLMDIGVSEVKLAVLVDKQTERLKPITADYSCLISPDVWLAGMGMDDSATAPEAYRWRDDIIEIS